MKCNNFFCLAHDRTSENTCSYLTAGGVKDCKQRKAFNRFNYRCDHYKRGDYEGAETVQDNLKKIKKELQ